MIYDNMLGFNNQQSKLEGECSNDVLNNVDYNAERETPGQHPFIERSLYDLSARDVEESDAATLLSINSSDLFEFAANEPTTVMDQILELGLQEQIETTDKFPNLDEYDRNGWQFELNLNPHSVGKSNWYYSPILQKVFIKLDKTFYIEATHSPKIHTNSLFIRAMMVFTEDISSPVIRCANHIFTDPLSSTDAQIIKYNVLRSENSKAFYTGRRDGKNVNDRLAVLIPLSPTNPDENNLVKHSIALKFVCQNSCIGRKQTAVIFTLENERAEIYAKKVINVKVCSCPKRDKEKDEEKIKDNKRPLNEEEDCFNLNKRPCKVIKIKEEPGAPSPDSNLSVEDSADIMEVNLNLTMPNIPAMKFVVRCAFNQIAGLMAVDSNPDKYKKYLNNLKKTLDQFDARGDN